MVNYEFELTETKPQPVVSIRLHTTAAQLPQLMGPTLGAVRQYLAQIGAKNFGPAFTAYYNPGINYVEVEIGYLVANNLPGQSAIEASEIPGGKQISYMHKGSCIQMEPVYKALRQWMTVNGYESTGVIYEFYYNMPDEMPENELLTKIACPIKALAKP